MLTLETFAALQAQADLLAELAQADLRAAQTLPLLTQLRKRYAPHLAGAALEMARLRQRGTAKFSRAAEMFFTDAALQQASSETLALYHGQILKPYAAIADLGCGIGGDLIGLGGGGQALGLDLDPLRLQMARHNAGVYGLSADFLQADLNAPLPFQVKSIPAAFFDPARRSETKRIFSIQDYSPPLERLHDWGFRALLVKISPGVRLAELEDWRIGIEFISLGGELKEALLHVGELAFEGFRATRLPQGLSLDSANLPPPPLTSQPLRYLYEPDPAIIRTGLFGELLAEIGLEAYRFSEDIAYLTGDELPNTPWLRAWPIHDWLPFNLKRLRQTLKAAGIGRVTVKKRGSPIEPEALQKQLRLKPDPAQAHNEAVIILTQLQGKPIVLISYQNLPADLPH